MNARPAQRSRLLPSASLAALAIGLATLPSPALAQRDFAQVEMKATKVAGSIWMLEGAGGNIGVSAGPDGILIVDDQFAPLADKIRAALKELNPGKLAFILNTHWHGDHTGSNAVFGPEATIVAHRNVRRRLAEGRSSGERKIEPAPAAALPEITFDDGLSIWFNGEEIRVKHVGPGHTDGDSVIFFTGSKVLHMGDHFFNGGFPFVDLDSGGDLDGYVATVRELLGQISPEHRVIPGHGPLASRRDVETFLAMLETTTRLVREQMSAGKSLEELKKAGLPAEWKTWGEGFIDTPRWIETIHRSTGSKRTGEN